MCECVCVSMFRHVHLFVEKDRKRARGIHCIACIMKRSSKQRSTNLYLKPSPCLPLLLVIGRGAAPWMGGACVQVQRRKDLLLQPQDGAKHLEEALYGPG